MPGFTLGEWLPDLGAVDLPGLVDVRNVYPTANGWRMLPYPNGTKSNAVDSNVIGANRGRVANGATFTIVGTQGGRVWLDRNGAGFVQDAGLFNAPVRGKWLFNQYGVFVLGTNGVDPPQIMDLSAVTPAFASVGADAPIAQVAEIANNFYILGNITGRGTNVAVGRQEAGLHWSGIGDPTSWPTLATQAARDGQSDFQKLDGDGGPITAIVATEEYIAVFRARQVWRMDYVGLPSVFTLRLIDASRGCIVQDGAVAAGNRVFFPSQAGFLQFDGANITPIGQEKVDRKWFSTLNREFISRVVPVHIPDFKMVAWGTPSESALYFRDVFAYQYNLGQWTRFFLPNAEWIMTVLPSGEGSLDFAPLATMSMDALSPAGLGDVNLDTLGLLASVNEELAWFDTQHRLNMFAPSTQFVFAFGDIAPRIITGEFRDPDDRRIKLRSLRPHYRGEGGTFIAADARALNVRNQDPAFNPLVSWFTDWGTVHEANIKLGTIPLRRVGRYMQAAFLFYGQPVGEFQGFEANYTVGGRR